MGAPEHWGRDLLALREKFPVIVSVPTPGDLATEAYGTTRQEVISVLMTADWPKAVLAWAAGARNLGVPARANKRRLAEELVAAGPAYFGEIPPWMSVSEDDDWIDPDGDHGEDESGDVAAMVAHDAAVGLPGFTRVDVPAVSA